MGKFDHAFKRQCRLLLAYVHMDHEWIMIAEEFANFFQGWYSISQLLLLNIQLLGTVGSVEGMLNQSSLTSPKHLSHVVSKANAKKCRLLNAPSLLLLDIFLKPLSSRTCPSHLS